MVKNLVQKIQLRNPIYNVSVYSISIEARELRSTECVPATVGKET